MKESFVSGLVDKIDSRHTMIICTSEDYMDIIKDERAMPESAGNMKVFGLDVIVRPDHDRTLILNESELFTTPSEHQ